MKQSAKKKVIRVLSWLGITQAVAVGAWVEFGLIVDMLVTFRENINSLLNF